MAWLSWLWANQSQEISHKYDYALIQPENDSMHNMDPTQNQAEIQLMALVEARTILSPDQVETHQGLQGKILIQTRLLPQVYYQLLSKLDSGQIEALYCYDCPAQIIPEMYQARVLEAQPPSLSLSLRLRLRPETSDFQLVAQHLADYNSLILNDSYYFHLAFDWYRSQSLSLTKVSTWIQTGQEIFQVLKWQQQLRISRQHRKLQLFVNQPCYLVVGGEEWLPSLEIFQSLQQYMTEDHNKLPICMVQLLYNNRGGCRLQLVVDKNRLDLEEVGNYYDISNWRQFSNDYYTAFIHLVLSLQLPPLASEKFNLFRAVQELPELRSPRS